VFSLNSSRVFYYVSPCDMRKQIDGLSGLVRSGLSLFPEDGDLYVFINRRRDYMKVLFFDRGGFCLLCKRLEHGRFLVELDDVSNCASIELSATELSSLLQDAKIHRKVSDDVESADLGC